LPNIKGKTERNCVRQSPEVKQDVKKKSLDGNRLMEIIKKEISLEKRTYFQTISSDKALVIKNTPRGYEGQQTSREPKKKQKKSISIITEGEREGVLTPPFKIFRNKRKEAVDTSMPKTVKKAAIKYEWEHEYTPWNFK